MNGLFQMRLWDKDTFFISTKTMLVLQAGFLDTYNISDKIRINILTILHSSCMEWIVVVICMLNYNR